VILKSAKAGPVQFCDPLKTAFLSHPNWHASEAALRDLHQQVTFALFAACDQLEQITPLVNGDS
jgi:type I restriction enzyme, R subunit